MLTSSFPRREGDYFGPWILEYARELVRQGHYVTVIAPASGKIELDYLSEDNLSIERFNYFYPYKRQQLISPPGIIPNLKKNILLAIQIPFMLYFFYRKACKIIKDKKIDIIHSQWAIPAGFIGALVSKKIKVPHLITSQGAEFFLSEKHPFSIFTRFTLKRCDYLLPVSHQMAKRALKYGANPQKIKVIPNTVNPNIFRPNIKSNFRKKHDIPEDARIILTVRRLVYEKRVEDVINAFFKFNDNNTFLVIGGDGPEKVSLKRLCEKLGIENRVIFLGYVENKNLPTIYASSDIYVLSSQQEGLSLSLLESMSSGLMVISTAVTGGSEIIENRVNGFLYEVGDVEQLTEYFNDVKELSTVRISDIKEKARNTINERFSVEKMVHLWCSCYEELLN